MSRRQDLWKYLRGGGKISNSSVAGTSKCVGGSGLPHEHGEPHLPLHVEHNRVALRHFLSSGTDETAHIRANSPRPVIHELFATYGGEMASLQAERLMKLQNAHRNTSTHAPITSRNTF